MKINKFILSAAALVTMMSTACFAQDIKVNLNGAVIDFPNQQPVVAEGRTLIPLRGVFDKMGYKIDWESETKTVTLAKDSEKITVVIGENRYFLNGTEYKTDVPASIINGSTMLPLRAIADASGADVYWDGETKTAAIITKDGKTTHFETKTVTVYSPEERDFADAFTEIERDLTEKLGYYENNAAKINTSGELSEEDKKVMAQTYKDMLAEVRKAKNDVEALDCPERFAELKTLFIDYLQSGEDYMGITADYFSGVTDHDEYLKRLEPVAVSVKTKEAGLSAVYAKLLG